MNNIEFYKLSRVELEEFSTDPTGYRLLYTPEFTYLVGNDEIRTVNNENPSENVTFKSPLFNPRTHLEWFSNDLIVLGNCTHLVFVDRKQLSVSCFEINHVAAAWSKDHKYCCIVKDDGTINIFGFTDDACIIGRVRTNNIHSASTPKHEMINVGWGSQETQFKGKAVKTVAVTDEVDHMVDESPPTIGCDAKDNFIINFYSKQHNARTFKIFSSEGVLLYLGPTVKGMQAEMAWKLPSSVVFVLVSKKDCKEIQVYEKIGAFREKFKIWDDKPVKRIEWSDDGILLIVHQTDTDGLSSYISIYMLQQGAWSLKRYLEFAPPNNLVDYHMVKSQSSIYSIAVKTTRALYIYSFKLVANAINLRNERLTPSAVTNGNVLEVTLLSERITPPTMASCCITVENPIGIARFNPFRKELAILDSKNNLYIYSYESNSYSLKQTLELSIKIGGSTLFHMFYLNENCVQFFYYSQSQRVNILNVNLGLVGGYDIYLEECGFGSSYRECVWNSKSLVHQQFNRLYILDKNIKDKNILDKSKSDKNNTDKNSTDENNTDENNTDENNTDENNTTENNTDKTYNFLREYSSSPVHIQAVEINNTLFTFCLLDTGYFLADDYIISKHVSSFVVHGKYVHYIDTLRNEIISFHLNKQALHNTFTQSQKDGPLGGRPVERGALIVAGIIDTPEVVLQLPRGNLETIKLTLMLFQVIDEFLSHGEWTTAYDLIRMQKINSNILVDLDPERFTCNTLKFIESLESANDLNQFIEELSDDIEMYDLHLKHAPGKYIYKPPRTKMELCERILESIEESSSLSTHITCAVLACLVVRKKPVFKIIHKLYCAEQDNEVALQGIRDSVNCLVSKGLTDMSIFRMSLATFNIGLTRLVADTLKMDPQQFVNLLNSFRAMNTIDMRFAICDYLQNYRDSFSYLVRMNTPEDKLLEYIREKGIFKVGWRILNPKGDLYNVVAKEYAGKCAEGKTKMKLREASIIYQSIGDYKSAYCCAKEAGLWERCCGLINKLTDIDIEVERNEIAQGLVESKNFLEASKLYVELKAYQKAYQLLFRNGFYGQAHEIVQIAEALNQKSSLSIADLDQHVFKMMQNLRSAEEEFDKLQGRLFAVWEGRELAVELHGNFRDDDDASSLYAESSIASTSSSRQTKTTSRQRRKEEKKIASTRPGGKYEDLGLLRALHIKVVDITKLRNDTKNFVHMYLSVNPRNIQHCSYLVITVNTLIRKIKDLLPQIWLEEFKFLGVKSTQSHIIAAKQNIALLPLEFRVAPKNVEEIPLQFTFLAFRPECSSELRNIFLQQKNRLINDEREDNFI